MDGECNLQNPNSIYYLGYCNYPEYTGEARSVSPAANSKMKYISDVLNRMGCVTHMVSMAEPSKGSFGKGGSYSLGENQTLRLFPARMVSNPLDIIINRCRIKRLMRRFLQRLNPDDLVICYHSLGYSDIMPNLKKKIGFKLVLEVEEVYSDVTGRRIDYEIEKRMFAAADAFILSTELLSRRIDIRSRPFVVCSGTYINNARIGHPLDDDRIHVVYAGTLDPRKGGAAAAAAAGAFLDANYAMHILGGGSNLQVDAIKGAVEEANACSRGCIITYEGLKTGREFDEFVQSCHIGLSPQNPSAEFNTTSFPSKVFMYLSNGLKVVSVDLPVFEGGVRDELTLCPSNSPEDLASAIRSAAAKEGASPYCLLERLDAGFRDNLAHLFVTVRKGGVE